MTTVTHVDLISDYNIKTHRFYLPQLKGKPLTTDKIVQIPVSVGKPMRDHRDHNLHLMKPMRVQRLDLYQQHSEGKVETMWMGARRLTSINTLGLFISEDTPEQ